MRLCLFSLFNPPLLPILSIFCVVFYVFYSLLFFANIDDKNLSRRCTNTMPSCRIARILHIPLLLSMASITTAISRIKQRPSLVHLSIQRLCRADLATSPLRLLPCCSISPSFRKPVTSLIQLAPGCESFMQNSTLVT